MINAIHSLITFIEERRQVKNVDTGDWTSFKGSSAQTRGNTEARG